MTKAKIKIDHPTNDYEPKLFRDLVLVTRCKDCKYRVNKNGYCENLELWVDATLEFCSLGERKEE